jgi:hypothetical protein
MGAVDSKACCASSRPDAPLARSDPGSFDGTSDYVIAADNTRSPLTPGKRIVVLSDGSASHALEGDTTVDVQAMNRRCARPGLYHPSLPVSLDEIDVVLDVGELGLGLTLRYALIDESLQTRRAFAAPLCVPSTNLSIFGGCMGRLLWRSYPSPRRREMSRCWHVRTRSHLSHIDWQPPVHPQAKPSTITSLVHPLTLPPPPPPSSHTLPLVRRAAPTCPCPPPPAPARPRSPPLAPARPR